MRYQGKSETVSCITTAESGQLTPIGSAGFYDNSEDPKSQSVQLTQDGVLSLLFNKDADYLDTKRVQAQWNSSFPNLSW